jgi:alpha-L-fucosidase
VGAWMRINGEAVYGSKAWSVLGEGENGVRQLPGGVLDRRQAEFPFNDKDFRFSVGKNNALYAFCMTIPAAGAPLKIKSLNLSDNRLGHAVKSVKLLGSSDSVEFKQEPDGLTIIYPRGKRLDTAAVFKIE